MYIPTSYREERPDEMFAFILANPFGAMVTSRDGELFATHLPFVVDRFTGARGTLLGHIARANDHHKDAPAEERALVIFTGPDAYITPRWYPSKAEHGKVVPTWNYVAVHAYGTLRFRRDEAFLRRQLELLTTQHEGAGPGAWKVTDAPDEYVAQQLKAIVGLEVEITALEGKWKMSQNRDDADIDGVVAGLAGERHASAIADLVNARRPKPR
jgi:transcriptional regulator